jgi:membrane-bound ClpP family serine protease
MNLISRTITGMIMVIGGLILIILPLFLGLKVFVTWIYGIPIFVIGIFILFNKKEDEIEQVKRRKKK